MLIKYLQKIGNQNITTRSLRDILRKGNNIKGINEKNTPLFILKPVGYI